VGVKVLYLDVGACYLDGEACYLDGETPLFRLSGCQNIVSHLNGFQTLLNGCEIWVSHFEEPTRFNDLDSLRLSVALGRPST
jgi:hypothetical protein